MAPMPGLTIASLKKIPMLIPLFFCVGAGAMAASGYLLRLAFRSPDVSWYPKKNPEPWNEYENKQYKFVSIYNTPENSVQKPKY